jgi:hypothetical protein
MREPATPIRIDRPARRGRWLAFCCLPVLLSGPTAAGLAVLAPVSGAASSAATHGGVRPHPAIPGSAWNGATSVRSAWN